MVHSRSISNTVGIWNPNIWNPETFEIRTFWRSDFKWSGFSYQPFEIRTFLSGFQMFFDKMAAICPDFRSHSKSRPFATQPVLDHSKSRLGRISDPHCSHDLNTKQVFKWWNWTLNYPVLGFIRILGVRNSDLSCTWVCHGQNSWTVVFQGKVFVVKAAAVDGHAAGAVAIDKVATWQENKNALRLVFYVAYVN